MMTFCANCASEVVEKYEGPYRRYQCTVCETVFYENPRPCVVAVIVRGDAVLLTKRTINPGLGKWDLPGGFMERDEHPREALQREIKEELGVDLARFEVLDFFVDTYGNTDISTLNIAFVCQVDGPLRSTTDEFDLVEWFSIPTLMKEPLAYAFQNVEDILKQGDEIMRIASAW